MRGPYQLLLADGSVHQPSSFGELRDMRGAPIWNPDQLFADAKKAAQRVAAELEVDVEVVGLEGSGGKKKPVRAERIHCYREGDFVFVSVPGSFSYVRCSRPQS